MGTGLSGLSTVRWNAGLLEDRDGLMVVHACDLMGWKVEGLLDLLLCGFGYFLFSIMPSQEHCVACKSFLHQAVIIQAVQQV